MAHLRVLASIPSDSALPEDVAVNTWHFGAPDGGDFATRPLHVAAALGALQTFYTAVGGLLSVGRASPMTFRVYDMSEAEPRVPISETTHTMSYGANALPNEMALCLSFQASKVSGQNQARRRGRIYLGPLAESTAESAAALGELRPTSTARTTLANAAAALANADAGWSVYSPTARAAGADLPSSFALVRNGWVDNAFDVQRRRGAAPTARTLWAETP